MRVIQDLKVKLTKELPGHSSHVKVMKHRKAIHQLHQLPSSAKQSAVLLLLYPKNNELHMVYILRQTYKGVHSAQIGFPGGKVEKSDKNFLTTALREANEELQIQENDLEIVGKLTPLFVPPSNFIIHPFIAYQNNQPKFIPNAYEVAEIIEIPLANLLKDNALIETNIEESNLTTNGFLLGEKILWGATAMITSELLDVIKLKS